MAIYTPLTTDQLVSIARAFGLGPFEKAIAEPKGGTSTNYHLWAGGERCFLRMSRGKSDAELVFEANVLRFLEEARFPAVRLKLTQDGNCFASIAGGQATLFAYSPGEEVKRAALEPSHCRRIGELLGRLHDLSSAFTPERPNPYGQSTVAGWLRRLESDGGGDSEVAAALAVFRDELGRADTLPTGPRGLVHGDLFADNVLWIGDRVSSILDWEMSCSEVFAYDLAIALNAWCFSDRFEPERAAALLAGYRSRRRLDSETRAAVYPYARYAALRFATSRIVGYHLADVGPDRLIKKDWRRYRVRLEALRALGEEGFDRLIGQ
jgi:homoserine kinase type II